MRKPAVFISAAGHYSYAITSKGDTYSWGMGENYVLGNRDDCNQHFPYQLDPRMFEEKSVISVTPGTMHVVALVHDGEQPAGTMPQLELAEQFQAEEVEEQVPQHEPVNNSSQHMVQENGALEQDDEQYEEAEEENQELEEEEIQQQDF